MGEILSLHILTLTLLQLDEVTKCAAPPGQSNKGVGFLGPINLPPTTSTVRCNSPRPRVPIFGLSSHHLELGRRESFT